MPGGHHGLQHPTQQLAHERIARLMHSGPLLRTITHLLVREPTGGHQRISVRESLRVDDAPEGIRKARVRIRTGRLYRIGIPGSQVPGTFLSAHIALRERAHRDVDVRGG